MIDIKQLLSHNKQFVESEAHLELMTSKYPNEKVAILTCMDLRLTDLFLSALNLKSGDAVVIKNAGAVISHPFGSIMRSLLIAIYNLGVDEVFVIGHSDCGMEAMEAKSLMEQMVLRNIPLQHLELIDYCGIDLSKWLDGFNDAEESVLESVKTIVNHPLIPKEIKVSGFLMDPHTGALEHLI